MTNIVRATVHLHDAPHDGRPECGIIEFCRGSHVSHANARMCSLATGIRSNARQVGITLSAFNASNMTVVASLMATQQGCANGPRGRGVSASAPVTADLPLARSVVPPPRRGWLLWQGSV